jgi:hypothetical protein
MPAYVYLLAHKSQPRFKIGKALNLQPRIQQLGPGRFDLRKSRALRVADDTLAYSLERLLHRAFAQARIAAVDLVQDERESQDGNTEWFKASCMGRLTRFLEQNKDLLDFEPVGNAELRQLVGARRPTAKAAPRPTDAMRQANRAQDELADALAVSELVEGLHTPLTRLSEHSQGLAFTPGANGYGLLAGKCTTQQACTVQECLDKLLSLSFRGRLGMFAPASSYTTQGGEDGLAFRLTLLWPGANSSFRAFAHTAQLLLAARALPIEGWPSILEHPEQDVLRLAA